VEPLQLRMIVALLRDEGSRARPGGRACECGGVIYALRPRRERSGA
jgi:hypothetical protein